MIPEEVLAKLSPHRTHESNWLKGLLCRFGLHRWYYPDLHALVPAPRIGFCRWCPAITLPRNE
jgi:hypothetical protein